MFKGTPVETLTQSQEGDEEAITLPPCGTVNQIGGASRTPYFARRLVYCKPVGWNRFVSMRQALINYLGLGATWINLYEETYFYDVNSSPFKR